MCCNCLLQATEINSDFILEKMVRLQQFVDRIFDQFPVVKQGISKTRRFSYLIQDEMTPIRSQLDKLTENVGHVHSHFGTCIIPRAAAAGQKLPETNTSTQPPSGYTTTIS